MKKLQFKIDIDAKVEKVYETMLGENTFKQWTSEFNPTSDYEGSWEKGAKILFIGVNEEGKREGMIGRIEENISYEFVSIRYEGIVDGDKEITEGDKVEGWINSHENYAFTSNGTQTTVTVEVDVMDKWMDYFHETYPKALKKLKQLCESSFAN